jgi:hypothetical protein
MSKFSPLGSCQRQFLKRAVSLAPAVIPRGFLEPTLDSPCGSPTTRQQHSRTVTRYQTDLTAFAATPRSNSRPLKPFARLSSITARSTASPITPPKLAFARSDARHNRFAPLADFLERVPEICPHSLFSESSQASELANFIDRNHLIVVEKENFATRTAALVISAVGDNRLRHETLQRFMLANDSVTVAVEIPIWLTAGDIDALEVEHGVQLLPEGVCWRTKKPP